MVFEHPGEFDSQSAAITSIAPKIGCGPDTPRAWGRRAETDSGRRDGVTRAARDRIRAFDRRIDQLFRANPDCQRIALICGAGSKTATAVVASVGDGKEFKNQRHMAASRRMRDCGVTTNARLWRHDECAPVARRWVWCRASIPAAINAIRSGPKKPCNGRDIHRCRTSHH